MVPMIQLGTPISPGSWTTATAAGVATVSSPSAIAVVRDCDQRATTKARDGQLEEKRLEFSGSLCGGHRDDDGEGEGREGHWEVGPQAEGDDR